MNNTKHINCKKVINILESIQSLIRGDCIPHNKTNQYKELLKELTPLVSKEELNEIKECFKSEVGWLYVGLDFDSLTH